MNNNNESGINTLLLVVIVVILVGGAVWFYERNQSAPAEDGATINVTLPGDDASAE